MPGKAAKLQKKAERLEACPWAHMESTHVNDAFKIIDAFCSGISLTQWQWRRLTVLIVTTLFYSCGDVVGCGFGVRCGYGRVASCVFKWFGCLVSLGICRAFKTV